MKKIISLLASIAVLATMVTSVSAAEIANNAPVFETTIQELSATEFEQDWVGEVLEDGYKAYLVDVNVTGLDLESACAGTTNVQKKKRTGVLFMYGSYGINFESTDNIGAVYTMDGIAQGSTIEKTVYSIFLAASAPEGLPVIADGGATATATDAFLYQYVITTKGTVTGTIVGEAKISRFEADSSKDTQDYADALGNVSYKVDGVETNSITFGATGGEGGEGGEGTEPDYSIVISNEKTLTSGRSWDVKINTFESTATYEATFTDTDATETRVQDLVFDVAAETDGSLSFVTLLKTSRANVTLDVVKK